MADNRSNSHPGSSCESVICLRRGKISVDAWAVYGPVLGVMTAEDQPPAGDLLEASDGSLYGYSLGGLVVVVVARVIDFQSEFERLLLLLVDLGVTVHQGEQLFQSPGIAAGCALHQALNDHVLHPHLPRAAADLDGDSLLQSLHQRPTDTLASLGTTARRLRLMG